MIESEAVAESGNVVRSPLVGGALEAVSRSLSRRIHNVVDQEKLTADQWYVLDIIVRNDGIAMTEIARSLGSPAPTTTKHVDRLVTTALAFRLPDHADRRKVLVHASKRGGSAHSRLLPLVQQVEDEFMNELAIPDRQVLRTVLETWFE